jgi:uncharacterized repeat protein (TIGR01451 family)
MFLKKKSFYKFVHLLMFRLVLTVNIVAMNLLLPYFVNEANATPVSLTITKVKCLDPCRNEGLEAATESAPDFYAKVWINGVETQTPRGDEDQEEITPNWTIQADIPNTQKDFPLAIQIWDHDSTSGDDLGDTSPVPGKNNLEFTVNRVTGSWTGDVTSGDAISNLVSTKRCSTDAGIVVPPNEQCACGGNPGGEPAVIVCYRIGGFEDTDGDGLLDEWEKNGLDADSDGTIDVKLPTMGANPGHKDIFLELDWMTGIPPLPEQPPTPTRQAIQAIKAAFAAAPINAGRINSPSDPLPKNINNPDGLPGINLWVDTGNLTDASGNLVGDNLGGENTGGNAVPVSNISGLGNKASAPNPPPFPFYTRVKQIPNNFNPKRSLVFHYALSASRPTNVTGTSSGSNTPTTLNDTSRATNQPWIPNEWNRRTVSITAGTGRIDTTASEDGAGPNTCNDGIDNGPDGSADATDPNCIQSPRTVTSNNATSLTITPAWSVIPDATSTYSISTIGGEGEIGGNDFVEFNHDPGTIMHELGHNLNLDHGGRPNPNNDNCKPNYVSVMNYDQQFGIQQNVGSGQGQDFDGDGALEIIDYSPPRFPGGRGSAPLPSLVENNLNEATILNSADAANQFIYTRGANGKIPSPLNQRINWNGDPDTNDSGIILNINGAGVNGIPTACATNTSNNETLNGYNDWNNIVLNFRQFGDSKDGPINPVIEREPTLEDRRLLHEELNTTDLEIFKSHLPEMAVAGQELVYTITIKNNGPRLARNVQVIDTLPKQVTHISNTSSCAENSPGKLTCNLGALAVNQSKGFNIKVHIATDLPCGKSDQFFTLDNIVTVANLSGPDLNPTNNQITDHAQVLCVKYEYAAKLICGKQKESENMSLVKGFYATSINIHNPNDEKVYLFKKVALTHPPVDQKPGAITPLGIDTLNYDEALKADCVHVNERVFKGKPLAPYSEECQGPQSEEYASQNIEGFVIIQSPRSLDVTGVYTTANLGCSNKVNDHTSVHVEQIRERQRNKEVQDDYDPSHSRLSK